jgi:hypothetical protein
VAKMVVSEFVSLDLVMEPRVRSWVQAHRMGGGRVPRRRALQKYKLDEVFAHEALLLG